MALVLGGLAALVVAYFGATFAQVWIASGRDDAQNAEAIIVLGAAQYDGRPSPVLRARLDHAVELYEDGYAETIVVTGGRREADRFTEATAAANYLHSQGVPDSAILREVGGGTSYESLAASRRFLADRDISDVVLVSDPYHAKRIAAIASEVGLEAHVSPADVASPLPSLMRETMAVGLGRILGHRRLDNLDSALVARD